MKKKLLTLAIIPMVLTACGGGSSLSVEEMQEAIKNISSETVYPYYRVRGAVDYNNTFIQVDKEFTKDFREGEYIAYTRFNPGYYDPTYDPQDIPEEEILNFSNGSRAYWTRMPMRINPKNFYAKTKDAKGNETVNSTCAYSIIYHYIKSWSESQVKNADPDGKMYMQLIKNDKGEQTGFLFGADNIHSKITIDNYPEYADPDNTAHWPEGIDYDIDGPFPMYNNQIDASFNFRFEYDNNGWLVKEYVASSNYSSKDSTDTQFCCEALYTYSFHA